MSAERGQGLTRRRALLLAGAGAVSAAVGATGLLRGWGRPAHDPLSSLPSEPGAPGTELREPDVVASDRGRLQLTLTAAAGRVELAGRSVQALSYNGSVPGPTLRVRAGDRVGLDLENRLGAGTNLHVHGLHVSPQGDGDNVFVHVAGGETFRYTHQIPQDHPSGTFWYHPHLHGLVADQLFGGLAGAIVIERDDDVPLPVQRERMLVVTDVTLDGDVVAQVSPADRMLGRQGDLVLVNGQFEPVATVVPGGREHWRVVNACVSRFLRLRLDGAELLQVAGDAGRLAEPTPVAEVLLVPGNRVELLVRVPMAGRHRLIAEPVDRGTVGMMGPMMGGRAPGDSRVVTLVHVAAVGDVVPAAALPPRLTELIDLRELQVDAERTLTLATGMGMGRGMRFTIDGREFDPDRADTAVQLGTVEEWTITNDSPMDHPFHLHVWPMQVVARDGQTVGGSPQWLDVVNIAARGSATVRVRLNDFPGRTVYHCHILDHEDLGMMGVVEATG
jgi:FtsP/CotA-like multicopper oxidase with cupredoxin domain